jgi:hypothetical protein
MSKANHKGRSTNIPFIKMHRGVTGSSAWKALSCEAKCLVLLVWERHSGVNNGEIPLSHKEARKSLGIGNTKTSKAFCDARAHGFLIERTKGSFDWKTGAGQGRATEWELTTEPCDGKPAKAHYRDWKNQNAAPDAGTDGTQRGSRSMKSRAEKPPNGSRSSDRFNRFQPVSGS